MGRSSLFVALLTFVALSAITRPASADGSPSSWASSPRLSSFFQRSSASLSSTLGFPGRYFSTQHTAVKPPWFCHGIDCPIFQTVGHTKAYDARVYPAGLKWTTTIVTGLEYDAAVSAGFMRLFRYISGDNAEGAKVPMTAPVRVRLTPGAGPFCESNFTVSFFVPFVKGQPGTQIDPPQPADPEVFSETDPAGFTAYVRGFSGYADEKKLLAEAAALAAALERDGKGAGAGSGAAGEGNGGRGERDHFFFAGYDSPFRILGRHNEVWYVDDKEAYQMATTTTTTTAKA